MKTTDYQAVILNVPEEDPLANMPEERGRTRPVVLLKLRTDDGIEGIGITFYGGKLTATLKKAVEELAQITIGEDPLMIERIAAKFKSSNW